MSSEAARLQETRDGEVLRLEVRPAPPSPALLAMPALLGLLFGVPAIGVALDGGRRDAWSLGAMALGFAVAAGAAAIAWRAVAARRPCLMRLDAEGLQAGDRSWPWRELRGVELRHAAPAPEGGAVPHRLGAAIAARQRAREADVVLCPAGDAAPVTLASGLEEGTARRLRGIIMAFGAPHGLAAGEG